MKVRFLYAALAAVSCSVSTYLTIKFCSELRGSPAIGALPVALGVSWEAGKYLFTFAARTYSRALYLLVFCLVVGSIAASVGYLLDMDTAASEYRAQHSDAHAQLLHRREMLKMRLEVMQDTAKRDTEAGYRKRAIGMLSGVSAVDVDLRDVEQRISAIRHHEVSGGYWGAAAEVAGISAQRIRAFVYLFVAIMLELISIVSILLMCTPIASEVKVDRPAESAKGCIRPRSKAFDSRYKAIKDMVAGGSLTPSIRKIQSAIRCGQAEAQNIIAELERDRIIMKNGQGYTISC